MTNRIMNATNLIPDINSYENKITPKFSLLRLCIFLHTHICCPHAHTSHQNYAISTVLSFGSRTKPGVYFVERELTSKVHRRVKTRIRLFSFLQCIVLAKNQKDSSEFGKTPKSSFSSRFS